MVPGQPLSIAHVSPHPWGARHEVNEFIEGVAPELWRRGHRVIVAAPGATRTAVRESRRLISAARENPGVLRDGDWSGPRAGGSEGPPVLIVGSGLPMPRGPGPRAAPVPLDMGRTLETLLAGLEFDVVHVHDPYAPSAGSVALRHSRSLNVATFFEPSERILSTQVARPLVEIFFGRLDARTVSCGVTAEVMERFFPGGYEMLPPGADPPERDWWPTFDGSGAAEASGSGRPIRIAYCLAEERGAMRLFLRALRRLPPQLAWEAAIWTAEATELRLSRALRERVRSVGPRRCRPEELIAAADVLCVASGGPHPAPGLVRTALATATLPVASRLPIYKELTRDGDLGLLFPPGDAVTLGGQIERLIDDAALRRDLTKRGRAAARSWAEVTDQVEGIYERICARRHDPNGNPAIRRRLDRREAINVDLHMHTDHSPDCATPVPVLLETARERGLGAIAVTDHNEISGALAARDLAEGMDGIKVIVAEEVKTAEQGEVIGLFLEELIPRGMTMEETIDAIRDQGGLVYVPHPFDRLHSVPDYENLLRIVERIDILEVFNPRVAFSAFNEEAQRFATKYRIVPGAGSDSHVPQGLGSVMIRAHDFEGPEEFLEAMRDADIVRKHKNLVYVQALKLLQTAGRQRSRKPRPGRSDASGGRGKG